MGTRQNEGTDQTFTEGAAISRYLVFALSYVLLLYLAVLWDSHTFVLLIRLSCSAKANRKISHQSITQHIPTARAAQEGSHKTALSA